MSNASLVRRSSIHLVRDTTRVITRPFLPGQELLNPGISRAEAVIERLLVMSEEEVCQTLSEVMASYADRHNDLRPIFQRHFELVAHRLPREEPAQVLTAERVQLIGAYFTQEYAIEGAALFNPSIVAHPDQTGCADGEIRFIMSLRAVGEGHISSVEFRTGVVGKRNKVSIDKAAPCLSTGEVAPMSMSTDYLRASLDQHGDAFTAESVLRLLPEIFTPLELEQVLNDSQGDGPDLDGTHGLLERIRRTAALSYQLSFPAERELSERVMFPRTLAESHGLEDVRFIRFVDEDSQVMYYGTYTAFDGARIAPHLISTKNFETFEIRPMIGPAAQNKGMALFPRRIHGDMWSLSRWDRENISVARSLDGVQWGTGQVVQAPHRPWDLIQLGACSSPMETPAGWVVLTHGVGPMRGYSIGALLLELNDPTQVIGVLREPLLVATEEERDGYVPNVVYTCGSIIHGSTVVLPYGCSDASVRFAFVNLPALLERFTPPPA